MCCATFWTDLKLLSRTATSCFFESDKLSSKETERLTRFAAAWLDLPRDVSGILGGRQYEGMHSQKQQLRVIGHHHAVFGSGKWKFMKMRFPALLPLLAAAALLTPLSRAQAPVFDIAQPG